MTSQSLGAVVWLTGLSGAGKSTLAARLEHRCRAAGVRAYVLDGDTIRATLSRDLGFTEVDRDEHVRRVSEVAALFADAGILAIVAVISPTRRGRAFARSRIPDGRFIEVFVSAPLSVCEQRDVKGLYSKARGGTISHFTGLTAAYEEPLDPDLVVHTAAASIEACVTDIVTFVGSHIGQLEPLLAGT